jgi:ribosome-binding factor A
VSGRRTERLAEEIREAVAETVGQLKDPRIGFVTVTRVSVTADLRTARVYVGVLGETAQRERTLKGLGQAAGFIRRELGKRIRTRHTPELSFEYDSGLDATDRVAQLLEEARLEGSLPGADDAGNADRSPPDEEEGDHD